MSMKVTVTLLPGSTASTIPLPGRTPPVRAIGTVLRENRPGASSVKLSTSRSPWSVVICTVTPPCPCSAADWTSIDSGTGVHGGPAAPTTGRSSTAGPLTCPLIGGRGSSVAPRTATDTGPETIPLATAPAPPGVQVKRAKARPVAMPA